MSVSVHPEAVVPASEPPVMSVWERAAAVFTRPASAWTGLERRSQWWFPLLITVVISIAAGTLLYQRAQVPTMRAQWQKQVDAGQMPAEMADRLERQFSTPTALIISEASLVIILPLITLGMALLPWFGVGFVLGTKFPFRLALEVIAWAGLVRIPETVLTCVLGWINESMVGVHVGFGALLPPEDAPSRLHTALGVVLDAFGPLSLWYLVVVILGCAALSGAPRKSVAWVLSSLYVVVVLLVAALAAFATPGA